MAHTITATNCRIVVTYCGPRGTRGIYRHLVGRAKGPGLRMLTVSLSSVRSMTSFASQVLRHGLSVSLLVGGTKAVRAKFSVAGSKFRQAIDMGCINPCLLAHGLIPAVTSKTHVMGVISYACTVNHLSFPSFFREKGAKGF